MQLIIKILLCFLLFVSNVFATTHYVSYNGNGDGSGDSYENRGTVADFEDNDGTPFGPYVNGDTVCFYGTIDLDTANYGRITIPDALGADGSVITLDGSATGDCAGGGTQALIYVDGDDRGFYHTGTSGYLTINGFKIRSRDTANADYIGIFHSENPIHNS